MYKRPSVNAGILCFFPFHYSLLNKIGKGRRKTRFLFALFLTVLGFKLRGLCFEAGSLPFELYTSSPFASVICLDRVSFFAQVQPHILLPAASHVVGTAGVHHYTWLVC